MLSIRRLTPPPPHCLELGLHAGLPARSLERPAQAAALKGAGRANRAYYSGIPPDPESPLSDPLDRLRAALADRYRIERQLGQGGMATVYLAQDLRHDRQVALKVLKPELAAVLGAERFVVEIKTTAALQHPHILPLFDSGSADGFLYYVMPYIQGETLRAKLDRETQLGIDEAVRITREVADALDYAHRHGVIHRDIKPENILLHDGRPMVADFGIALALSAAAGGRMTETGLSLGTPHYMSPEQATAEKDLSNRSDIYSLGCVLYEMLTGSPPHVGATAQQIIMKIVTEEAAPVTKLRKSVPPNVAAAVARAIEKLPADRFESAKAFADGLADRFFTAAGTRAGTVGVAPAVRRVNRGLVLLALGLAAVLVWQLLRPSSAPGPRAYDVALPDSAPVELRSKTSFAIAPSGTFVIYRRAGATGSDLWYRGLLDVTIRQIAGTEGASFPTIAPGGKQVAFVRAGTPENTVEVMPVDGGAATVIARSRSTNSLEWLSDGRILLSEGDGGLARLLDAGGGPSKNSELSYCINPSPLPDRTSVLCGGGGDKYAAWRSLADTGSSGTLRTSGRDSSLVFGADFRVVADRYVVYLSNGGDLLAAPIDLASKRIGKPARMVTGLERGSYSGAGSYAVSPSGTLVYANGANEAVGHLVRTDGTKLDTLPVGREAFLQFAVSPDGRRLASVVERLDGQEVRIYDLSSGEQVVWMRGAWLRQPVWSPSGDRLVSSNKDSVFVGPPDATGRPEVMLTTRHPFEGYAWLPDGRLIGTLWTEFSIVAAQVDRRPATLDTLARPGAIGRPSPDRRWLAYNSPDFGTLWLEPFPGNGQRYAAGTGLYPQWLGASELVALTSTGFERISIDASVQPPRITRRPWFAAARLVRIQAGAFGLTPDGRVVYKQGEEIRPARYLRVIPNWVAQMKQAVAEANR
jgi:eukaryotic-like serine/threonine-protein kinase